MCAATRSISTTGPRQGATGWAFADVLPYFKRMETAHGGEDGWRGTDGPLATRRPRRRNPLYDAFVEAARRPASRDPRHQRRQAGRLRPHGQTVQDGRRWSAANAYLRPALKRQNVSCVTGCAGARIVIEGSRAVGVDIRPAGSARRSRAAREVILAGVVDQLAEAADAVRHRPGGASARARHRRSSPTGRASARTCRTISSSTSSRPARSRSRSTPGSGSSARRAIGAAMAALRDGLGATNHFESGAFIRSRAGRRLSRHPVPFPAARRPLRRQGGGQGARLPGPCRADALARARLRAARARPTRASSRRSASTT